MGFCGRCGAETRDGADYCPECGAPLRSGIAPKPSGGKLIPIVALIVAAILVAAGVYYVLNDNGRPATDSYIITFSVEDLVVHSDDETLYNIQHNGEYYSPDGYSDSPYSKVNLKLKVTVSGEPDAVYSKPFSTEVNSRSGSTFTDVLSLEVQNASSISVTLFLCTSGDSTISILSGSQNQTGVSLAIDLNQSTSVLDFTGGPQPYASGKLVINVTPA